MTKHRFMTAAATMPFTNDQSFYAAPQRGTQNRMIDIFAPPAPLQIAVLFLVFNRPDTTSQVLEAIRRVSPLHQATKYCCGFRLLGVD